MSDNPSTGTYDIIVIGAGSGGLVAARFAASIGARVALIEKHRVGGDCTWTGCVPSKALIKAAKVAHEARTAAHYGICVPAPAIDMAQVREYVRGAIAQVYRLETPEALQAEGIDLVLGAATFLDPHTLQAGGRTLRSKRFLIATGAHPVIPDIPGLADTPYLTYETIFDNDRLPERLTIIGSGPIGAEIAQAYQRLGAQVTVIGEKLLPRDEPEAREIIGQVLRREGVRFILGRATAARRENEKSVVRVDGQEARGDLLLVAVGRAPNVEGLGLEKAGVAFGPTGIPVNSRLQSNVSHIYAAGDCNGGYQFTHFAGWQAFQAARNALLIGSSPGFTDVVPWCTFTDPEVAHVGLTQEEARKRYSDANAIRWDNGDADRAVCENDTEGFVKLVHRPNGKLLGATVVAARAGEVITEIAVAMRSGLCLADLAGAIHPYPTYSTTMQLAASGQAIREFFSSFSGRIVKTLSGIRDGELPCESSER